MGGEFRGAVTTDATGKVVLGDGATEIPDAALIEDRLAQIETRLEILIAYLLGVGFELPEQLLEDGGQ